MEFFYGDSFDNLKRKGYEPTGKPAPYEINIKLVSDKKPEELDDLEKILNKTDVLNNKTLIKKSDFEKVLIREVTAENSPYFKFVKSRDEKVERPFIKCVGIVVYFNYGDEKHNPCFMVGGRRTGKDYLTIVALKELED
ncbi:MAG: hypothetical protein JSW73_05735 [Candidatus Woesearchaeota archaeon]|nr:MAG: hypothetical protein JSW73_05735 [Candidatus Woesearchaeota archaeon]